MKVVIENIQMDKVRLSRIDEGEETLFVNKKNLPDGIKEGDVLNKDDSGYSIDTEATKQRLDMLTNRMNRLFNKKRQGS